MSSSSTHTTNVPLDILHMILRIVRQSDQLPTLASFQRTSKLHYDITTPYLYTELIISDTQLINLLKSNKVPQTTDHNGRALSDRFKLTRKLSLVESSFEDRGIEDVEALDDIEALLENSIKGLNFPNIHSVSLVVQKVTKNFFLKTVHLVAQMCTPRNLCFTRLKPSHNSLRGPGILPYRLIRPFAKPSTNVVVHQTSLTSVKLHLLSYSNLRISHPLPIAVLKELFWDNIFEDMQDSVDPEENKRSLRLIVRHGNIEEIQAYIETFILRKQYYMEMMADWTFESDPREQECYHWYDDVEWIYGEGVEFEPPCQACGLPV